MFYGHWCLLKVINLHFIGRSGDNSIRRFLKGKNGSVTVKRLQYLRVYQWHCNIPRSCSSNAQNKLGSGRTTEQCGLMNAHPSPGPTALERKPGGLRPYQTTGHHRRSVFTRGRCKPSSYTTPSCWYWYKSIAPCSSGNVTQPLVYCYCIWMVQQAWNCDTWIPFPPQESRDHWKRLPGRPAGAGVVATPGAARVHKPSTTPALSTMASICISCVQDSTVWSRSICINPVGDWRLSRSGSVETHLRAMCADGKLRTVLCMDF